MIDYSLKPKLIGLTGQKRTGKGSVAFVLTSLGYVEESFADPIYKGLATILDVPVEELREDVDKDAPDSRYFGHARRHLLQTLGTEWGRHCIDPEIWVKLMFRRVNRRLTAGSLVVVSDVRFDNEAKAIREYGGEIWRMERDTGLVDTHVSEAGIDYNYVTRTIKNNGTLTDLRKEVICILESTLQKSD